MLRAGDPEQQRQRDEVWVRDRAKQRFLGVLLDGGAQLAARRQRGDEQRAEGEEVEAQRGAGRRMRRAQDELEDEEREEREPADGSTAGGVSGGRGKRGGGAAA